MIDKIKQILNDKNIKAYKICERIVEANELFFIKKYVDMDRAKSVHHYKLTVYLDYEENAIKYKGSMETNIYPTMDDTEIIRAIEDAIYAARFVKNPFYPLNELSSSNYFQLSNMSEESLPYWMNEITKALYESDKYKKGGINSCEIFLNKNYTRIINSQGVDVDYVDYDCMVEFITTWKEEGEEIELYKSLHFSDFDSDYLTKVVKEMIVIAKEKAIANNTPTLEKTTVLLTREAVKDFFNYYYTKSSAASVYNEGSTWKIGDKIQGEEIKGDLISMMLDPFMKNSTYSRSFDEDGYPLAPIKIIEDGVLKRYHANTKYAYYLNVEPTGSIENLIVCSGSYAIIDMKKEPHLEVAAFSDFTVDGITGDFGGEIRLAWYFDGERTLPVTGGSITGNINDLHNELYLSKEIQKDNNFEGPQTVKLLNVSITGIE